VNTALGRKLVSKLDQVHPVYLPNKTWKWQKDSVYRRIVPNVSCSCSFSGVHIRDLAVIGYSKLYWAIFGILRICWCIMYELVQLRSSEPILAEELCPVSWCFRISSTIPKLNWIGSSKHHWRTILFMWALQCLYCRLILNNFALTSLMLFSYHFDFLRIICHLCVERRISSVAATTRMLLAVILHYRICQSMHL